MHDVPDSFRDLSLEAFIDRLASSEPVPGGGSASAVAASLAAGLVAMVAGLSRGRPALASHDDLHVEAGSVARALADRFLTLAQEDATAYGAFAAARRLPRATDEERAARVAAMHGAARLASEVPLRCVEACREILVEAERLAGRCNMNCSSDLRVAALLTEAAARGAAENVLVNLPSIDDQGWAAEAAGRVEVLLAEIERLSAATRNVVASGATREPIATGSGAR